MPAEYSTIYALTEFGQPPIAEQIRYVGKTTGSMKLRMSAHLASVRKGSRYHSHNWIRLVLASGGDVQCHTLAVVAHSDASHYEQLIIRRLREAGSNLTNMTDGGEGQIGRKCTEETRAKISASHKGVPLGEKHRSSLRAALRRIAALPQSKSARARNARRMTATPEARAKIAAGNSGKVRSVEHRSKISVANLGKKASAETRRKMSEASKNRDPIYRQQMSDIIREWWRKRREVCH